MNIINNPLIDRNDPSETILEYLIPRSGRPWMNEVGEHQRHRHQHVRYSLVDRRPFKIFIFIFAIVK